MIAGRFVQFRPIEQDDQAFLCQLNDDPVVRGNVVGWDWPRSTAHQERWFANAAPSDTQRWMVLSEGERMGLTGLWDVDWHNRTALTALKLGGQEGVRGRGLGSDAIKLLMAFAFYDVGLHRLHSTILSDNTASLRAYTEKCGWHQEGVARKHVWRHGDFIDLVHVGILREEFDALPDSQEYREYVCRR